MEEQAEVGWICSISEHTELVQGRVINDTLKNLKKYFWKGGIKFFFEKNFFRPKNFKKLSFLVIFWQKFSKVTEPEELSSHRVVYVSGKWPYWSRWNDDQNFFSFFLAKKVKNGQKWPKNEQKWSKMNIFEKKISEIFFFKSIQNVLKRILNRKNWYRKIFPLKIFSGA